MVGWQSDPPPQSDVTIAFLAVTNSLAIWAAAYVWLGALGSLKDAILYSLDSMTTRGASGLTLEPHWQMMGALEAANGMLLFGISTAYIFAVMQVYWPMLSDLRESGCLTGDTPVYVPETGGYETIAALAGRSGFDVLALDPTSWKLVRRRVESAFSTGVKPVYRLTTALGRSMTGSRPSKTAFCSSTDSASRRE